MVSRLVLQMPSEDFFFPCVIFPNFWITDCENKIMTDQSTSPQIRERRATLLPSEGVEIAGEQSLPHTPMHSTSLSFQNSPEDEELERERRTKGLEGDRGSIALLTFLYVLQGIPLGLAGSIPYLLQSRNVNYKDQAVFSFNFWPFSVKLLWAPIVDAAYSNWMGRRKSWLVPVQYLIGVFMFVLSAFIPYLMGEDEKSEGVNVYAITGVFFMLNFLAATQDIAVDGWALTMLSRFVLDIKYLLYL